MASCPRCSSGQGCLLLAAGASWGGSGVGSAGQLFLPLPVPWRCSTDGAGACCGPVSSCFKRANTQYFGGGFSQPGSAPQSTSQCCAMQEGSTHCTGSSASRHTATCFPGKWGRSQCESPEISCERGDAGRITALGSFHVCKCVCSSATRETTTQLFFHVLLPFLACSLEGCGCYPCFVTCLKIRSSQQRCC